MNGAQGRCKAQAIHYTLGLSAYKGGRIHEKLSGRMCGQRVVPFDVCLLGQLKKGGEDTMLGSVGGGGTASPMTMQCTAEAERKCFEGQPTWFDSCGTKGDAAAPPCAMTESCIDGACVCNAALPDKQVCAENFVVRQNGCGQTLETIEECSGGAQCVDGACV